MVNSADLVDRIYAVMRKLGLNKTQMGEKIGNKSLGVYLLDDGAKGRRDPVNLAPNLSSIGVSIDWFFTGKGEMFLSDAKEPEPAQTQTQTDINQIATITAAVVAAMDAQTRQVLAPPLNLPKVNHVGPPDYTEPEKDTLRLSRDRSAKRREVGLIRNQKKK
ncbi:MAG: hypothetical protein WCF65_10115 [Parachlamydiaceae bacterium]